MQNARGGPSGAALLPGLPERALRRVLCTLDDPDLFILRFVCRALRSAAEPAFSARIRALIDAGDAAGVCRAVERIRGAGRDKAPSFTVLAGWRSVGTLLKSCAITCSSTFVSSMVVQLLRADGGAESDACAEAAGTLVAGLGTPSSTDLARLVEYRAPGQPAIIDCENGFVARALLATGFDKGLLAEAALACASLTFGGRWELVDRIEGRRGDNSDDEDEEYDFDDDVGEEYDEDEEDMEVDDDPDEDVEDAESQSSSSDDGITVNHSAAYSHLIRIYEDAKRSIPDDKVRFDELGEYLAEHYPNNIPTAVSLLPDSWEERGRLAAAAELAFMNDTTGTSLSWIVLRYFTFFTGGNVEHGSKEQEDWLEFLRGMTHAFLAKETESLRRKMAGSEYAAIASARSLESSGLAQHLQMQLNLQRQSQPQVPLGGNAYEVVSYHAIRNGMHGLRVPEVVSGQAA